MKSTRWALLEKAETRSSRVLDDTNLTDVFGIKLGENIHFEQRPDKRTAGAAKKSGRRKQHAPRKAKKGKYRTQKKTAEKSTKKPAKTSASRRKSPAKPAKGRAVKAAVSGGTIIDIVVSAIPKRRKTMRIADICARVDLSEKQVRNAVARAVVQGKLKTTVRGIYARS